MEVQMGNASLKCKKCGSVTTVENKTLESMCEFVCPSCGVRMYDYEFARLKMHYYVMLCGMYRKYWGSVKKFEQFDYQINLWPHYEHSLAGENEDECI